MALISIYWLLGVFLLLAFWRGRSDDGTDSSGNYGRDCETDDPCLINDHSHCVIHNRPAQDSTGLYSNKRCQYTLGLSRARQSDDERKFDYLNATFYWFDNAVATRVHGDGATRRSDTVGDVCRTSFLESDKK